MGRAIAQLQVEEHAAELPDSPSPWSLPALQAGLGDVARLLTASDLSVLARLDTLRAPLRAALAGHAESLDELDAAMQRLDLVRAGQACQILQQALARMAG